MRNDVIDNIDNSTRTLWMDHNFKFVQIYTGLYEGNGEMAVAFEPQSGCTNGYNNGDHLTVLYPTEEFVGSWGISMT